MPETILNVEGLQVQFRAGKETLTALRDVSFDLKAGETIGIVGESGCGKSVTATAVMGLLPKGVGKVSGGSIAFQGRDLTRLSPEELRQIRGKKISMIFQDPMTALNPVYTIGRQLVEMLQAHSRLSRRDAWGFSIKMLEKVGIPVPEQRMREYPHQLSGGMRQRVMIAMALSVDPRLLIADEPTTALDVTIQAQILDLMNKLKSEYHTAIMMITHDMGVIAEVADQVMVMYAGEVVEYAPVRELFRSPTHPYTRGLIRSIPRLDEDAQTLYTIPGMVPGLNEMPQGCRFSTRCGHCTEQCRREVPPLTDYGGHKVRCFQAKEAGCIE